MPKFIDQLSRREVVDIVVCVVAFMSLVLALLLKTGLGFLLLV
jgi:hypothetical protein